MADRRLRNVRLIVLLVTLAAVGLATQPSAQPVADAPPAAVRVADLVGVWTGQWLADRGGALEVILARDPAERHAMERGGRLAGEFSGGPDMPVRRGSLDLIRMRKS
jgi:hypothetical protein